jgi:pimeloyl-ACP methyl ester carboxylesterase
MAVDQIEVAPGVRLAYELIGGEDAPTVLLVAGLGVQLYFWPDSLCRALAAAGLRVVRFDNRDVGCSSKFDDGRRFRERLAAALRGETIDLAYTLDDLTADAVGLLDALDVASAHVVGASMGGAIAQLLAIRYPQRIRTLTSIMSSSGEDDYGQPWPGAMAALLASPGRTREEVIDHQVKLRRLLAADAFDEAIARADAVRAYDRGNYPPGVGRHLLAAISAPARAAGLRGVRAPALVIHGDADPLVDISGGRRVAELVPGSQLLVLPGTGHDLAERDSRVIAAAITELVRRAPG